MQAPDLHRRIPLMPRLIRRDPGQPVSKALVARVQDPSRVAHQRLDINSPSCAPAHQGFKVGDREVRVNVDKRPPDAIVLRKRCKLLKGVWPVAYDLASPPEPKGPAARALMLHHE